MQTVNKTQTKAIEEIKKVQVKEDDGRDEASLIKKPLIGWKWANCERDLNNLETTQGDFYNWKKLPYSIRNQSTKRNKINMNLHNIGQGFSKMLQTFSSDNLHAKDLLKASIATDDDNDVHDIQSPYKREFLSDNEEEIRQQIDSDSPVRTRIFPNIQKVC